MPCGLHGFSPRSQAFVDAELDFDLPQIEKAQSSLDKTVKFLMRLKDGLLVETVLIPFQGKYTVCLSSQVGCAVRCSFCFTGRQGLTRNLATHEIVGQFLQAQRWATANRPNDDKLLNVVFMGQGEPLHNFDAVRKACEIMVNQVGLSLAAHKITISTSGHLPGLRRFKAEMPNVNIAISLHSAFNEKRSQIIPLNDKYPLEDVIEVAESIPQGRKRFVTYEYLLLKGFNDTHTDAQALIELLKGKKALLNLIPFNPYPGAPYQRPTAEDITRFQHWVEESEIPVMVRTTKGDEILAACGQLNTGRADSRGFPSRSSGTNL